MLRLSSPLNVPALPYIPLSISVQGQVHARAHTSVFWLTPSSTLPWKIPWTEEPGRLQSMGSQRVGHD